MGPMIIGVDAATEAKKVGLARGQVDGERVMVRDARLGSKVPSIAETIARWIEGPTLLAIDAPLGWPAPLGRALAGHRAGQAFMADAKQAFNRSTDRALCERTGKRPLDVGADRIARTACAALGYLEGVRRRSGETIALLWAPMTMGVGCIEVYPAATLRSRGIPLEGYKKNDDGGRRARGRIVAAIEREVDVSGIEREVLVRSDHGLDAVVCLLAGLDFLLGRAVGPTVEERESAEREGWIWVRG